MESPGRCRLERDAAHDEPLTRIGAADHNDASHVSSAASFRHAGFRGACSIAGGSDSFMAASFMRTVIAAYRFVVSRTTCAWHARASRGKA